MKSFNSFLLSLFALLCFCSVEASQVNRIYKEIEGDDDIIKFFDFSAEFNIDINVTKHPKSIINDQGDSAWIFEYTLQNKLGIEIEASHLKLGDYITSDLKTVAIEGQKSIVLLKKFNEIPEDIFAYLNSKHFRVMYDVTGKKIDIESLKEGQEFEAYKRSYDSENIMYYEESGFQTLDGRTLIENGTTLEAKHVAMLQLRPVLPTSILYPIKPSLDFYLRMDWPEEAYYSSDRFWVRRPNVKDALYLLKYEIKEGDIFLGDIILPNKTILANSGAKATLKGERNSIEILNKYSDAYMVNNKDQKPIRSIEPISPYEPNTQIYEPGDLAISPQNKFEFRQPYLIQNEEVLSDILSRGKLSYSRFHTEVKDPTFPYYVYLTHYRIPFLSECIFECDELLDLKDSLIQGSHKCPQDQCNRTKFFEPYVTLPSSLFSHLNLLWENELIHCAYCSKRFKLKHAYASAGDQLDGAEFDPISVNFIHPKDIIPGKSIPTTDISYYMNGEEITINSGEVIDEDTKQVLMERSISPIYVSEPSEEKTEAAQCPFCFGWNTKPLTKSQLRHDLNQFEVRRGAVSFKNTGRKVNRLDLIIFGLNSDIEPTSGRKKALVVTYKRYGDEHFQFVSGWNLTEKKWKYLPRYDTKENDNLPISALPDSLSGNDSDDEFLDDF